MSLDLFRIDERLLHGQVIVGWGMRLGLERYVVVDDDLAGSEWEQDLYAAGLPASASVEFLSLAEIPERLAELIAAAGKGAVLTRSTGAMRMIAEAGLLEGRRVNVGGLHDAEGRTEVLRYVSLRPEEADDLRAIAAAGAKVSARDIPTSRQVELDEMLDALD